MPNYADFMGVVANEESKAIELSGSSIALLLTALGEGLENTLLWRGSGEFEELTQAEKDEVEAIVALAERELMAEYIVSNELPYFAHLFHHENKGIEGNAIAISLNANQAHNFHAMQNTPAVNDSWLSPMILLREGDYELKINCIKNSQSGIVRIFWNGSQIAEQDLYTPTAAYNQILTYEVSSIGGENQVGGVVVGKNASSSAYRFMISDLWVTPTVW